MHCNGVVLAWYLVSKSSIGVFIGLFAWIRDIDQSFGIRYGAIVCAIFCDSIFRALDLIE
jgi:hypothetical protein